MKVKKLDPRIDKPSSRSELDKEYMINYALLHGTAEQKAEFKACLKANMVTRTSKLTGKEYKDVNLKNVRDKFCELFFPSLLPANKKKETLEDLIDKL